MARAKRRSGTARAPQELQVEQGPVGSDPCGLSSGIVLASSNDAQRAAVDVSAEEALLSDERRPSSASPSGTEISLEEKGALPREFGRYQLFDTIGAGGMAEIFLARARTEFGASRLVVVKQILDHLSDDEAFAEMLVAEAKLAAQLNHGNVVQVFDLGREEGRLFIAMEYVEGFDLNQLLGRLSKARLALPAEFALLIVRETLRGLAYAHRAKSSEGAALSLVHRDVSPSNVLISFEGEVKLCDFGIARAMAGADAAADDTLARIRVAGKSAYMSPEQARGEDVDARSDVFGAGVLLWELCAGRRMYKGSEDEMLAMARAGEVPALPDRGMPNHEALNEVVMRALCANRDERFGSAEAFLDALETYAIGAGLMASPLRFGTFLTDHFAEEIVQRRRARERSAAVVEGVMAPVPSRTKTDGETTLEAPLVLAAQGKLSPVLEGMPEVAIDDARAIAAGFDMEPTVPAGDIAMLKKWSSAPPPAGAEPDDEQPSRSRDDVARAQFSGARLSERAQSMTVGDTVKIDAIFDEPKDPLRPLWIGLGVLSVLATVAYFLWG